MIDADECNVENLVLRVTMALSDCGAGRLAFKSAACQQFFGVAIGRSGVAIAACRWRERRLRMLHFRRGEFARISFTEH